MANGKEQSSCNVETFSAEIFGGEIFGGANGSFGREKGGCCLLCRGRPAGVLYAVPRAAGGADTSQGESRGWGR